VSSPEPAVRPPWRQALDPRPWILASLSTWRGFCLTWAVLIGAPVLILAVMILAVGGPGPGAPADGEGSEAVAADPSAPNATVAPPPAVLQQMARLSVARTPPPPEFPPAQVAPAPPSGRLFGLRADQRTMFDLAAKTLVSLKDACGARLDPAAAASDPPALTQAQAALDASIKEGDKVRALVTYHHGLIDLCAGQLAAARSEFARAITDMDSAGAKLKAATARDNNRLAQYRIVAHYGLGVAEMAAGQPSPDYAAADRDFQAALTASQDPALLHHAGAFVELSSARGDLFDFSSAAIVQARIAVRLAQGDLAGAAKAAQPVLQGASAVIGHPALAVTLALAASAGGAWGVVDQLDKALKTDMGPDPASSDWVANRKALLTQFLEAAATAPVGIFAAGDQAWWPGGADTPAATDARRVFDARADEGLERDALWFPPLATAPPQDAEVLDRFLWIRREMVAAAGFRFDRLDALRRAEAALPAADRAILANVRRQLLREAGSALMAQAERARGQEGGEATAKALLTRLSSFDFPVRVWLPARLARVTGLRPGEVTLALWALALAAIVLFLVHRELWIGYRRTFPHRHHDQRRRAGPGWADVPAATAREAG
jgi:hypothetical protein